LASPADGAGKSLRARQRTVGAATVQEQYVLVQDEKVVTYKGRAGTFRIPGSAAVTHKLLSVFNAAGSTTIVSVDKIFVDVYMTVVKAATVPPPIIRIHRATVAPTGGTALAKVAMDSALTTNASVTLLQGASVDGTASVITHTIAAGTLISQEIAARLITAAGYEPADRVEFLDGSGGVLLRAGEGLVVEVASIAATSNPATDMWSAGIQWSEFTLP